MKQAWCVLAGVLLAWTACGAPEGKRPPAQKETGKLSREDETYLSRAKDELKQTREKMAKNDANDFSCTILDSVASEYRGRRLPEFDTLIKDIDQTCGYDLPIMLAEAETAKAEAARKAKPKETVLSECISTIGSQFEKLKAAHADDPRVKSVVARWGALCSGI